MNFKMKKKNQEKQMAMKNTEQCCHGENETVMEI